MLVVTRKADERIVFPSLGITVHILRLTSHSARVGIDAPPDIRILRHELETESKTHAASNVKKANHALANALSKVTLAIHLARKQWIAGLTDAADATMTTALQALESLETHQQPPQPTLRCRALIVEDDPNERELLAGLLGMNGCECAAAEDGVAAIDYLENHDRPDVVLLDMAMPRRDGPETLRMIRTHNRLAGLRVFSVSSTSPEELNIPNGPMGFDGWFPKPLNPRRLWSAIQSAAASRTCAN